MNLGITVTMLFLSTDLQPLIDDMLDCCTYAAQNHTMAPKADSSSMPHATPVTAKEQDFQAQHPSVDGCLLVYI